MAATREAAGRRFFLGWVVVAAAAASGFAQVAFFNPVLGVFIPEFEREFGWSRTEISLGVTVGTLGAALIAPFFGPLIDRYGGRPFVVGGGLLMSVLMVVLANVQTEWQYLIVYGAGRSMAAGLLSVATMVTVSKWFIRRRGMAVGVSTLGSRLGFAVLPIGVQLMIDASGWRSAAYVLALAVFLTGVLPASRFLHRRPEVLGLLPDGDTPESVAEREASGATRAREVNWTRHDAMRTWAFWLITLAASLQTFAGGAVNLHQIPFMVDQGLSPSDAAIILSLFAVFAAMGGLLEGILDDHIGSRVTFIVGLVGSAAGMVVLMLTDTFLMGVGFAVLYGVSFGLMITSQQVVYADYFGREALGAIRGAALPLFMTLQAFGPIVGGGVYDATGSYIGAFVLFALGYLLAAGALIVARRPEMRAGSLEAAPSP